MNLKKLLPHKIKSSYHWFLARIKLEKYLADVKNMTVKEIFSDIYKNNRWGVSQSREGKFYSGIGSHDKNISETYIHAICAFLDKFKSKPDVVDLGCGDFYIGSRIRPYCGKYVAIDVVEELIEHNKKNLCR